MNIATLLTGVESVMCDFGRKITRCFSVKKVSHQNEHLTI